MASPKNIDGVLKKKTAQFSPGKKTGPQTDKNIGILDAPGSTVGRAGGVAANAYKNQSPEVS